MKYFIFIFFLAARQLFSQAISGEIINPQSFYYVDFLKYPIHNNALPVGVFDSGTGGLTVLDAIINFDEFQNNTKLPKADGQPDFAKEKFIYLADQANMPYGNYAAMGKTDLLQEHVLKDVQFLLGNKYYQTSKSINYKVDKQRIKVLVIACNTATAYGQKNIEEFFKSVNMPMKVIGVIDAGSRGALQSFDKNESGSIGIFATAGTITSKGYETAIRKFQNALGYSGEIQLYGQGGVGLAEAIDEDPNFIARAAKMPRDSYRGPNLSNANMLIERQLIKIYNFDFADQKMLCDAASVDDCSQLQINSAENYVRYHLVSLLEKMRATPNALPLKTLILGCTHYPYMATNIQNVLSELRNYSENGETRYKHLLAEKVILINPATNTAKELFDYLVENKMFNGKADMQKQSEFYISMPNLTNKNIQIDSEGRFTYEYKFGRNANEAQEFIKVVPFSNNTIPADVVDRLRLQIPKTFDLIKGFSKNKKLIFLPKESRLSQ